MCFLIFNQVAIILIIERDVFLCFPFMYRINWAFNPGSMLFFLFGFSDGAE